MRKLAIVTATRAEYGLLSPIIRRLREFENDDFVVELIVCGTHLSNDFGMTVTEIDKDGFRIDHKIPTPVASDSARDISNDQSVILNKFADLFESKNYNGLLILGDRYEMLAIAVAAGNAGIPVFHISGGDTTEGAVDEWIRHSITKISYIHFVTNESSRKRVIQLGEEPDRVFNYGSTAIDNIKDLPYISKSDILTQLGLFDCRYAVCTYHPVTNDYRDVDEYICAFIKAMEVFPDMEFILTKSNSDRGGARINELLEEADRRLSNVHVYTSLGVSRYLSLLRHSEFIMGNSSSGIVEAPALHIPTVNIGDRQKGRLQSESVINCGTTTDEIVKAIEQAVSDGFKDICKEVVSPYGTGHSADKIASKTLEVIMEGRIDLKKRFYDLEQI